MKMSGKAGSDALGRRPKGTGRRYAYDLLRQAILTLEFLPGATLDEAALVEQIGVSRTLVREAMITLSSEGLVEILPNRGARVTGFNLNDVRAFHEGIELIQRAVTRWSAVRSRPEHLLEIKRERLAFERAVKARDADAMTEGNRRFHMAIAEGCGNPLIAGSYERLLNLGLRLSRLLLSYDINRDVSLATHLDRIVHQHREMERTIANHDADSAEALGAAHARLSLDRSLATLGNSLSSEITLPAVS
jgi:DNA-binding GntR family transcriptional regulator